MTEHTIPEWVAPGKDVYVISTYLGRPAVKKHTITRVTKTRMVFTDASDFLSLGYLQADGLIHTGTGSGWHRSSYEVGPLEHPKVQQALWAQRLHHAQNRLSVAADTLSKSVRRDLPEVEDMVAKVVASAEHLRAVTAAKP